ncbi:MAG: N-acetylneuraminate synthase family protein [Planctomycetota bacterium]|jgi:N-acetylneuraminate synthase/N,N'-diacetyllegionaminate synthase
MSNLARTIKDRTLGDLHPPLIIAELGVNHDGDPDMAVRLVEEAHGAGVDAIKTQVFVAELLVSPEARLATYQATAGETDPVEMLSRLELSIDGLRVVHERAHDLGLISICTIFTPELVAPTLDALTIDALKLASPDLVNTLLLDACAQTGLPMILSTGCAALGEIDSALGRLGRARDRVTLMQCVSAYPTPDERASLGAIGRMLEHTGVPVGYSDHTTSVRTGAYAVARGACALEKHLTCDRTASGPDHAASLDPIQMREYVALAREAHSMLGQPDKSPLDIERDVREASRQSLVLSEPCAAGQEIRPEMLSTARPGAGFSTERAREIIGMVATQHLPARTMLKPEHLAPAPIST